ncbi:MAG: FkbM family methyltransferase [Cyanobacteria bacterium J06634_6]
MISIPKWLKQAREISHLFLDDNPISIVDVGASVNPPENCARLASVSTYIGFDPDLRKTQECDQFGFLSHTIIDKAVSARKRESVSFYLTRSPECSSTLAPDMTQAKCYSIGNFFDVIGQAEVSSITLGEAASQANLASIDWLKLDTQGTDLDIFSNLEPDLLAKVLVVDLEPGILPFYIGENKVSNIHDFMLANGFWLSDLTQQRYPRISQDTVKALELDEKDVKLLGDSPFAVELQYFRTIESLERNYATKRDFAAFWVLAMANANYAFAIEIAVAAERHGLKDSISQKLVSLTLEACRNEDFRRRKKDSTQSIKNLVPSVFTRILRRGKLIFSTKFSH